MTSASAVSGGGQLTPTFLTQALAAYLDGALVTAVSTTQVGTGQVSDSFRLILTCDRATALPETLIAKVPAANPASRNAARTFRTYELEARFYDELAAGLPVSLATCYFAAYDPEPDEYIVLLEDHAQAYPEISSAASPATRPRWRSTSSPPCTRRAGIARSLPACRGSTDPRRRAPS